MKLICLNVAIFETNNDKLKNFFENNPADFLALQEVTRRVEESAFKEYISKNSIDKATPELKYQFFAPNWLQSDFEIANFHGKKLFKYDLGGLLESGNYIRSKYKILHAKNIFVQNHFALITDWSNWPTEDYKCVESTDIQVLDKKIRILNYHGLWSKEKQDAPKTLKAAEIIQKLAQEVDYPVIICGDFNLFPDTKSMQILSDNFISLVDKYNIKTTRPKSNELSKLERNVVDYIFVSPGIKINNFEVLDSNVSDHLPLILDFEI